MEILLDCVPCLLKQALEASRFATDDERLQELIINDSLEILNEYKSYKTSPELARDIHRTVKLRTGINDPYEKVKDKDLKAAKAVYPILKEFIATSDNKLYWALKTSATGNNLDSAIYGDVDVDKCVKQELQRSFAIDDSEIFKSKLATATNILIIGDNTGETVFDKVLIETLPDVTITYAVRDMPIINDATIEEAILSELDQVATIISSGCNAPGLILDECSEEFLSVYMQADIIISKGQGNFEALSEKGNIFFLLKAKCPMIARRLDVELNDYVLKYKERGQND